jgi:predicted regulator of Ras-like GTPase activity (Roadblock/LC7/MglB family)
MMLVTLTDVKAGLGHVIIEMSRAVTRLKEIFG